jgi:hypothetical protein
MYQKPTVSILTLLVSAAEIAYAAPSMAAQG